jgi:hypothetical protein
MNNDVLLIVKFLLRLLFRITINHSNETFGAFVTFPGIAIVFRHRELDKPAHFVASFLMQFSYGILLIVYRLTSIVLLSNCPAGNSRTNLPTGGLKLAMIINWAGRSLYLIMGIMSTPSISYCLSSVIGRNTISWLLSLLLSYF